MSLRGSATGVHRHFRESGNRDSRGRAWLTWHVNAWPGRVVRISRNRRCQWIPLDRRRWWRSIGRCQSPGPVRGFVLAGGVTVMYVDFWVFPGGGWAKMGGVCGTGWGEGAGWLCWSAIGRPGGWGIRCWRWCGERGQPGWCVNGLDGAQWARPAASDPGGAGQRRVVRRRRRRGGGTQSPPRWVILIGSAGIAVHPWAGRSFQRSSRCGWLNQVEHGPHPGRRGRRVIKMARRWSW